MEKATKRELVNFETKVKTLFEKGKITCPVHLSGGNEDALVEIFKSIKEDDYVFSTHRNHFHYLLKTGDARGLLQEILGTPDGVCKGNGRSMHIYNRRANFFTSAIVGGICPIAVGVSYALKAKASKAKVWAFIGDGGVDTPIFHNSLKFARLLDLPLMFVIEDNDLAVDSSIDERWHIANGTRYPQENLSALNNVIYYQYVRKFPHVGVGRHIGM